MIGSSTSEEKVPYNKLNSPIIVPNIEPDPYNLDKYNRKDIQATFIKIGPDRRPWNAHADF